MTEVQPAVAEACQQHMMGTAHVEHFVMRAIRQLGLMSHWVIPIVHNAGLII